MFGKKIRLDKDTLIYITILYLYLPIMIFICTWLKLIVAIPVLLVCVAALYRFCTDVYGINKCKEEKELYVGIPFLLFSFAVIILFGYYMGWTGDAPQSSDWSKHNAVLRDLVEYEWPVYYRKREAAMLTYYIGQYILPAFLGKIFSSFAVAQYVMYVWNCIGVLLILYWLIIVIDANSARKQILTVVVFLLFGGMLPVAQIIVTGWRGSALFSQMDVLHFLDHEGIYLQYRSNLTDFRWVFPQCIMIWIMALLFLQYRESRKHYATMLLPGIVYGTLSFLGLALLIAGYLIFDLLLVRTDRKSYFKELFSVWNVGMLLTLGGVLIAYLWGNVFSEKPAQIMLAIVDYSKGKIFVYFVFCVCMYGIYVALIAKKFYKDILFWIMTVLLSVIPFVQMGYYNDFCMCVSIPLVFVLMIYLLQYLFANAKEGREQMKRGILIACICIGALYPCCELYACIRDNEWGVKQMQDYDGTLAYYADRSRRDIGPDLRYNYYTYDLEESFFVQYLARKTYDE